MNTEDRAQTIFDHLDSLGWIEVRNTSLRFFTFTLGQVIRFEGVDTLLHYEPTK